MDPSQQLIEVNHFVRELAYKLSPLLCVLLLNSRKKIGELAFEDGKGIVTSTTTASVLFLTDMLVLCRCNHQNQQRQDAQTMNFHGNIDLEIGKLAFIVN